MAITLIEFIYKHEPAIRLSIFLWGFVLLSFWEWRAPRRKLSTSKLKRWKTNFALILTSTVLVRLIIPTAAVGMAYLVEKNNWGFANYFEINFWLKVVITFVLLDLTIYFQHLFFHVLPILWRVHRVHHSDLDCDVTTGIRFHPIEILLSIFIKLTAIIVLGAPILTVIIFEIILNIMSMFTHSNICMNKSFEYFLRWFITTPDMHRIHHSMIENETNSNFTFFISLWDRIFGTYLESPEKGHIDMTLGLSRFKESKCLTYTGLMKMPVIGQIRGYAINYRDTKNADELEKINSQLRNEIQSKEKHANELIVARDIAEKANETKSKFISNISHELRTPMHGILSYSKFGIKRIDTDPRTKLLKYFTGIKASGDRLLNLINNLLDLAKLESKELTVNLKSSNILDIIDSCVNEQNARLEEKQLTTKVNLLSESAIAMFDPILIGQVITNLLSNSIKFSDSNSLIEFKVFVEVPHLTDTSTEKPMLYCSIQDEGLGIPDGELYDIFTSFTQSSRTETGAGGTGLGLAISMNIIEAHKGTIWAENNPHKSGTIITFAIPIS